MDVHSASLLLFNVAFNYDGKNLKMLPDACTKKFGVYVDWNCLYNKLFF